MTPDYFRVMRIPLRRGRVFSDADTPESLPVMLVGEATARMVWPGVDPIGKQVRLSGQQPRTWTVIGVVGDVRHYELGRPPTPQFYVPQTEITDSYLVLVVRAPTDVRTLVPAIRRQCGRSPPTCRSTTSPRSTIASSKSVALRTFLMLLLVSLAAIAITLAAAGLYGVTAQSVAARQRELGIRMALGATRADVASLVLVAGCSWWASACSAGRRSTMLGRFLSSQLYQTAPTDPISLRLRARRSPPIPGRAHRPLAPGDGRRPEHDVAQRLTRAPALRHLVDEVGLQPHRCEFSWRR